MAGLTALLSCPSNTFKPETAIFTDDKQDFHHIADHVDQFAKRP